jgi:hypothetical protein
VSPAIFDDIPVSVEILLIDAIIGAGLGSYDFADKAVRTGVAIESEGCVFWDVSVLMDTPREALAALHAEVKKAEADHLKDIANAH